MDVIENSGQNNSLANLLSLSHGSIQLQNGIDVYSEVLVGRK
jgi:hypothetical protein